MTKEEDAANKMYIKFIILGNSSLKQTPKLTTAIATPIEPKNL